MHPPPPPYPTRLENPGKYLQRPLSRSSVPPATSGSRRDCAPRPPLPSLAHPAPAPAPGPRLHLDLRTLRAPRLCINKEEEGTPGAPPPPVPGTPHQPRPRAPRGPAARGPLPWPGISDDRRSCRLREGETQKESLAARYEMETRLNLLPPRPHPRWGGRREGGTEGRRGEGGGGDGGEGAAGTPGPGTRGRGGASPAARAPRRAEKVGGTGSGTDAPAAAPPGAEVARTQAPRQPRLLPLHTHPAGRQPPANHRHTYCPPERHTAPIHGPGEDPCTPHAHLHAHTHTDAHPNRSHSYFQPYMHT